MSAVSGLAVDVYLPRGGGLELGPFSIDPLRLVLGFDLRSLLDPYRRGPTEDVVGPDDVQYRLLPLLLPDGTALSRRVELLGGTLGLGAADGLLRLVVPNRVLYDTMRALQGRLRAQKPWSDDSTELHVDVGGEVLPIPVPGVGAVVLSFPQI